MSERTHVQRQQLAASLVWLVLWDIVDRKGFDDVWDTMKPGIAANLVTELTEKVARELEALNI